MGKLKERIKKVLAPTPQVKTSVTSATCELYATFDQTCPLCQAFVPARQHHRCGITNAPPRKR